MIPTRRQQFWTFRTRGSALNRARPTLCAAVGTVNSEKDKAESVTPTSLHRPSLVKASPWPRHPDHRLMRVVLEWGYFLPGVVFFLEAFRLLGYITLTAYAAGLAVLLTPGSAVSFEISCGLTSGWIDLRFVSRQP